jgi:hypothetical protein
MWSPALHGKREVRIPFVVPYAPTVIRARRQLVEQTYDWQVALPGVAAYETALKGRPA